MTPRVQQRRTQRSPLAAQVLIALGAAEALGEGTLLDLTFGESYQLSQRSDRMRHLRAVLRTLEKAGEVERTDDDRWRLA